METNKNETITDFAGNTYPASALNEQETPSFDPWGAKKDRAWKALGDIMGKVSQEAPKVGDNVEVIKGKKHLGKRGEIFWRGKDRFAGREYGSDMQRAMSSAMGLRDRVGIRTLSGERFFVRLRDCEKIQEEKI